MEKVFSYILLFAALTLVLLFGGQTVQFPNSFARRKEVPRLHEWFGNR